MHGPDSTVALDIESDNSNGQGLNPAQSRVTEIAIATAWGGEVFADDDELALLLDVEKFLADLPPSLILTWNGSCFDLPFITDRFATYPVKHGWQLTADPQIVPKYDPLPGHAGGYSGLWQGRVTHQHLDISRAYKKTAADLGVSWSLKPVCAALGIEMFEIDRTRLHEYSEADRARYCLSDSTGTRDLGLRLLGWA